MIDAQKAERLEELFGDERIKWDAEYCESSKEFGIMSTLRRLNIAYYVQYLQGRVL